MLSFSFARFFSFLLVFCLASGQLMAQQPAQLDQSFNMHMPAFHTYWASAVQPDGKILVAGYMPEQDPWTGTWNYKHLVRLNPNGTRDNTFTPVTIFMATGNCAQETISKVAVLPDGKILISGAYQTLNNTIAGFINRLLPDGTLDTSFALDMNFGSGCYVTDFAVQPDGKIVVVGAIDNMGSSYAGIKRLNANGSTDLTFNPGTGADLPAGVLVQPDGKIMIWGGFTSFNGIARNKIARLNANGSLDMGFTSGINGPVVLIMDMAVQPDGKVIAGGYFSTTGAVQRKQLARLNSNGSLDATFASGLDQNEDVISMALQPDGRLIIVGNFFDYSGTPRNRLARTNPDGSLDNTFDPGIGFDSSSAAFDVLLLSGGKVLLGGAIYTYGNIARSHVIRIYGEVPAAQAITTWGLSSVFLCQNTTLTVRFTADSVYTAGNVFSVQLSDPDGSFASPTVIGTGTGTGTATDSIVALIPANLPFGLAYRIRVVSSAPAVPGYDNGTDIRVHALPMMPVAMPDSVSPGGLVTLENLTPAGSTNYSWSGPGLNQTSGVVVTANPAATGTHTYTITATEPSTGCTSTALVPVVVDAALLIQGSGWGWVFTGGSAGGFGQAADPQASGLERQIITGEAGIDIAADATGNTVTLGRFKGTATFGATTLSSQGTEDIVLIKTNATGQVQWVGKAGGTAGEQPHAVALDAGGNAYICGSFSGSATFGTTPLAATGATNSFLVKYAPTGTVMWARNAGGTGTATATDVAVNPQGNIILTGHFTGNITFGGTLISSAGSSDIFVACYDASGTVLWATRLGGAAQDGGYSVATDAQNNTYLTGSYQGTVAFGATSLTSPVTGFGRFFCKLDAQGGLLWANATGNSGTADNTDAVAVNALGGAYLSGTFEGSLNLGATTLTSAGATDIYLLHYTTAGDLVWARRAGGSGPEIAMGITADSQGQVYLTGSFNGYARFGNTSLSGIQGADIFVAKYDTGGNCLWARKAGGITHDLAAAIAVDSQGNSYLTGYFQGTATFGINGLVTSSGQQDLFITRLDHNGVSAAGDALGTDNSVTLFPNPFVNGFSLRVIAAATGRATLELLDMLGRTVYTTELGLSAGENLFTLQAAQTIPQGIYLVQVKQGGLVKTIRAVKQ